jgi:hypothetical protein
MADAAAIAAGTQALIDAVTALTQGNTVQAAATQAAAAQAAAAAVAAPPMQVVAVNPQYVSVPGEADINPLDYNKSDAVKLFHRAIVTKT